VKIAFCTTCRNRLQHLESTLLTNILDNWYCPEAVFVVLEYGDTKEMNNFNPKREDRLVVYQHKDATAFRMAHAKNLVHRCGMLEGADVLCNLDADNYTGPDFASYLLRQFDTKDRIFMWARMIKDGDGRLPRGISGRIAVTRQAFLAAGGYDEKFDCWSPDDKDFNSRLQLLGYTPKEIDPRYLRAILHNDKLRFKEYPYARNATASEEHQQHVPTRGIANEGNFGCGIVYRNFDSQPIELKPLASRVFGIGMHKTGTTSLAEALNILGLDCVHWPSAKWARAVFRDMVHDGTSPTLDRHYSACDLPIAVLFRELDKAYPGSKFILTIRNENDWLRSVKNHWDPEKNKWRCQWDHDNFTHRIHAHVYGRTDFDPETMLNRYRQHNQEVMSYFFCRPNDLLVMDLSNSAPTDLWRQLCGFLDCPVPAMRYPEAYKTV